LLAANDGEPEPEIPGARERDRQAEQVAAVLFSNAVVFG
jgi:hypothetical protein